MVTADKGPLRAHWLQHVPFEGLGSIESWLVKKGAVVSRTRLFAGEQLPEPKDVDLLIVMGGPMSVRDENDYPWLVPEKRFVGRVIEQNKPVLGICLGAQMLADVLGARIFPNEEKEIGWFDVHGGRPASSDCFVFPDSVMVFHWHGETFDLPEGAVHLAASTVCRNQAFQVGRRVIGLQFHLETTSDSAVALVENCSDELVSAPYIQDRQRILSASPDRYESIHHLMSDILDYLVQDDE